MLTILSGATFNDQTTSYWTEHPCDPPQRRHGYDGGGEQRGHLYQERVGGDLDDLHAVQQHQHGGRPERDAEPVGRRHRCRGDLQGPRHSQLQRRHADAGRASSITGNATFSGGQTTVNGGTGTGLLTVTGGTATFNGAVTTGALKQTGGELNGSGTLTVTGTGSLLTGGTESGSGTTNVQGGVSFGNGSPGPVTLG